ncbi:MAG: AraC family transcriptional regulator [Bacteroides sp.]|nr:AraC family transcriptional regulator [Bacteroides sp.]MCM1388813.1 AraC family transcriptional regulator [Bacteroides sp.]
MKNEMDTQPHIYFPMSIEMVSHAYHLFSCHTLAYLYSGKLYLRNQCGEALSMIQGDCAFIGRDSYTHLYAEPESGKPCRGLFFSLPREFLCEFYQTLPASIHESSATELPALHLLESTAETKSLFRSWLPYIRSGQELPEKVLRLKMVEAVHDLLNTDERYIPTLFDFAGKCRMDMFDLLQKPVEKEIRWQEFTFEPHNKLN